MSVWHTVRASSFADRKDLEGFAACKAKGHSDHYCFAFGDNGIGLWGDKTGPGTGPSCALPPEVWHVYYHQARLKKVVVRRRGKSVICELKDTMPPEAKAKAQNGALIDLNADACAALGLKPPVLATVDYRWAEENEPLVKRS